MHVSFRGCVTNSVCLGGRCDFGGIYFVGNKKWPVTTNSQHFPALLITDGCGSCASKRNPWAFGNYPVGQYGYCILNTTVVSSYSVTGCISISYYIPFNINIGLGIGCFKNMSISPCPTIIPEDKRHAFPGGIHITNFRLSPTLTCCLKKKNQNSI